MNLKQYYLGCLAHASYMIADEETKIAAVVDPQRDIDQYIQDAETNKWDIRYVFLTHFHADFLAGHLELREKTGAQICLGANATAEYPFRGLKDGDTINFGQVQLRILETPGHTPEGISIVVSDLDQSSGKPHAVLTGDTLFIGDVGRPDLMASVGVSAKELGGMLYDSLHQKLLALPNETLVYPAHGAGSMCGKNLSTDTVSTIGTQRWYNYALQPMSRSEFVNLVASEQPEAPAYFGYDAQLNRQNRETLDAARKHQLTSLSVEDMMNLVKKGAQVLDVREPVDFAGGHLVNSINIGLSGKFATWAGIVLNPKTPIVLIAEGGREEEAMTRLGRIGFDQVSGYLEDGMMSLKSRPDLIRRTTRITAATLAETLTT
ncbi:MAG: MBL fold metallo-hydrolase, partial [Nitrospirota bacterium]